MKRALTAIALVASLAGCATPNPVSRFTLADVQAAQSIASAGGDATGATCWGAMLPVAQTINGGGTIGLAAASEIYRVALIQAQGPCAPIVLPVIMKLGPLLGLAAAPVVAPVVAGIP